MSVLAVVEHVDGEPTDLSLQALTFARGYAGGEPLHAIAVGLEPRGLGDQGVGTLHVAEHDVFGSYAPAAVAQSVVDLIVFGNESADSGNYQVGIRVAYALGLPVLTGLKGVAVEGGRLRGEREAAGGRDVYEVPLPAVVTVLEGLNLPRYPSVPGRMRAQRKPVAASTPSRPGPRLEKVRLVVPAGQGKQAEILGHGPEAAPRVVEILTEIGVL